MLLFGAGSCSHSVAPQHVQQGERKLWQIFVSRYLGIPFLTILETPWDSHVWSSTIFLQTSPTNPEAAPAPRSYHRMVADGKVLYVFGGCSAAGRQADLHAFDTEARERLGEDGFCVLLPAVFNLILGKFNLLVPSKSKVCLHHTAGYWEWEGCFAV